GHLASGITNTVHFYETAVPRSVVSISLTPAWAVIPADNFIPFSAVGYDIYNNQLTLSSVTWSIVNGGGTIDSTGIFYAGSTLGTYLTSVSAQSGSAGSTASVTIVSEDGGAGSGGSGSPTPTP